MLLTAVFAAVTILAAESDLFKFVPRSSICIGYFDISKLWKNPEVAKQTKKPEIENFIKKLNNTIGFSFQDISSALVFTSIEKKGGYLIKLKKPVNLEKFFDALKKNPNMQSNHLIGRYVIKKVNNKKVFLFDAIDKSGKINKIEVAELAPGVILNTVNTSYASYINELRGIGPELRRIVKTIPNSLVWFAANVPANPYQARNVALNFDLIGKQLNIQQYVCRINFETPEQATQIRALLPMYFNMGLGILFSFDPTLGAKIAQCLKSKVANNQVILTVTITKKIFDEIIKYINENQEQLKNLIPNKPATKAGNAE